ncbi:MAG: acyl-CoA dehydrogenase family protein [Pseudomonadaceae bacterium]|nr:acyl-CoA dehydrogenase family protein [Pseudomonadaceae bacterium]
MQIALATQQEKFAAQVEAFVQAHWPVGQEHVQSAQIAAWRRAVVHQGWSVPAWPEQFGGTGWNAIEHFIWQQVCARHNVDQSFAEGAGVTVVGPMLIAAGRQAAQDEFLADIRGWRTRWCLALFEPACDAQVSAMTTTVGGDGGDLCLSGDKSLILDLRNADWLGVVARCADQPEAFVLVAVPVDHPGLSISYSTTLDGVTEVAHVSMHSIELPSQYCLTQPAPAQSFQQLQYSSVYATLARSASVAAQLERIDAVLATLSDDEDLAVKRNSLAVDLAGLQALELRCIDALARGQPLPVPLELMRLRSGEILLQVGALQIDCFGYYALPYPDPAFQNPMLLHNEGPIGPIEAAGVMQQALAEQVNAFFEQDAGAGTTALKDRAAKHLEIAARSSEEATENDTTENDTTETAGKTADKL